MGDYPFLLMTVGAAHEVWVWLLCAVSERRMTLAAYPAVDESNYLADCRSEERTARRMLDAFQVFVQHRSAYYSSGWIMTWWDGLVRDGVDEIGIALFSRVVTRSRDFWRRRRFGPPAQKLHGPLAILEPLTQLFHERLGRTPEEVQRRAEDLLLDEDHRTWLAAEVIKQHGFVIQEPEDGYLTYDERRQREHLLYLWRRQQEEAVNAEKKPQ